MASQPNITVTRPTPPFTDRVLTPDALEFLAILHRQFENRRREILAERVERQRRLDAGWRPDFDPRTETIRQGTWGVAPPPADLEDRRVEITGPTDRKMIINALNSGARVFMADFEDANSPTWRNMIEGQANLMDAVRGQITYTNPEGHVYRLRDTVATLMVRPRGWHLVEHHLLADGEPISASLFDFGLFVFHNAKALVAKGTGPYLYLPKLEHYQEAALWAAVFRLAEDLLGMQRGTIRATVLIETVLAALCMDEILYELRDHVTGLNAGRWDYLFSVIKRFGKHREFLLPDRAQLTMTVPFMQAYTTLLVETCHRRGAHAIGGMAAFIPSRRHPDMNQQALEGVRQDKLREVSQGFDGTWVAHPDLVPVAREVFDKALGSRPHQLEHRPPRVPRAGDLLDFRVPNSQITEAGLRMNIQVALRYLASWLGGQGAVAIFNLMEDTATAEICRAQLWQWVHHQVTLPDGRTVSPRVLRTIMSEEMSRIEDQSIPHERYEAAYELLEALVLRDDLPEFLTVEGQRALLE